MCTIVDEIYIHDIAVIKGGRGVELPNPHSSREYVTDTVQISQNLLYALRILCNIIFVLNIKTVF